MLVKTAVSFALAGVFAAGAAFADSTSHEVSIYDNDFMPPLIYAEPGDTMTILNEDDVVRQATAKNGAWTTGPLAPGESFTIALSPTMQLAFNSADESEDEDGVTFVPSAEVTFKPAPLE